MTGTTNWYADFLKAWPRTAGAKPTASEFEGAHKLGARPGTKVGMALAMYLRNSGATTAQVIAVVGGPQLNKARGAVASGAAVVRPMPANAGHKVYALSLAKGGAKAPAKAKGAAKAPAKAKGAAKAPAKAKAPRKAKGAAKAPATAPKG